MLRTPVTKSSPTACFVNASLMQGLPFSGPEQILLHPSLSYNTLYPPDTHSRLFHGYKLVGGAGGSVHCWKSLPTLEGPGAVSGVRGVVMT